MNITKCRDRKSPADLFIMSFCSSVRLLSDKVLRVSFARCRWLPALCARIVSQLFCPESNNDLLHLRSHCRYRIKNASIIYSLRWLWMQAMSTI